MISLKMLSTAAALALLVPMVAPSASYAEGPKAGRAVGAGGTAFRTGGGTPSMRMLSGALATSFAAGAPAVRPSGGVAWNGGRTAWNGGGGGAWNGGYRPRGHDGRLWARGGGAGGGGRG